VSSVVPESVPRTNSYLSQRFGKFVLSILGWKIEGSFPNEPKLIAAVAPHTSNWDFIIAIAMKLALRLKVTFMGKDAIFFWPLGILLRSMGGLPIERKHRHGVVGQMVEQFAANEQMLLGLAPEGTRSKTKEWKTGFLTIAKQSQVPVVAISLDFATKTAKVHEPVLIKGDIQEELKAFKLKFAGVCAKNPHLV